MNKQTIVKDPNGTVDIHQSAATANVTYISMGWRVERIVLYICATVIALAYILGT